jgi:hypothetical protein
MAKKRYLTFEDVNEAIDAVDLAALEARAKPKAGAAVSNADLCAAYKMAKPILVLASNVPLIPEKWRNVLKAFIAVADGLCK